MNKQMKLSLGLLAVAWGSSLDARNIIGTPLPLYLGWPAGHVHYPSHFFEDPQNCLGLDVEIWGAGYYREAIDAYGPSGKDLGCAPGLCTPSTSQKVNISELIFGSSAFTLAQSFAGSSVGASIPTNPWVTASTLHPLYDYSERGAFFGLILGKRFNREECGGGLWWMGVRLALPYRDIDMDDRCSDLTGETIDDVLLQRQETITNGTDTVQNPAWAARLDFLSALDFIAFNSMGNEVPLVIYSDPNNSGHLSIGQQDASGGVPTGGPITNSDPFIAAIDSSNGLPPASVRWADTPQNSAPVIAGDGTGLVNLERGRFASDVSYIPLGASTVNQSKLWIVPNVDGGNLTILDNANSVFTAIIESTADLDPSVGTFLQEAGIDFCTGRSKGIGDLDMLWYLGYTRCQRAWGELQFGVRFPTGKKLNNCFGITPLALQPLGNNGHFEIRPGLVLGWEHCDWLRFKLDVTYSIALRRTELVPAPFTGATVSNLGPLVPAQVSWSYFWGEFDITLVHPYNQCVGATIAYQPFVKLKDNICFNCTEARDFLGNLQTLDPSILIQNTKRIAHTLRTEVFLDGECCKIYAGFAQVVAGRNVTRDMDLYLGIEATF